MARILIVDDEFGVLDALSAVLEDAGHHVSSARDGAAGLDRALEERPDLIVLDYAMPVMDGAELLRRLRRTAGVKDLPVLMISGLPESMVRRQTRSFQAFLRKPFGLDEFLGAVARLLSKAPAQARRRRAD